MRTPSLKRLLEKLATTFAAAAFAEENEAATARQIVERSAPRGRRRLPRTARGA
jgi:hypothetical protein